MKEVKCIVWDLDNTIWNGILLEGDSVELKPGIDEVIRTLDRRGILHSIASRGHYDDAMSRLREFRLNEFFLYPQIDWGAKSLSVAKIQKKLNIGMDSMMFVDDQPFELDEVKSEHPEITCIHASEYMNLPANPRLNPDFVTEESKRRRLMYIEERIRQADTSNFQGPRKDFLASLDIHLSISKLRKQDLQRAEELTVRTNQFNATGESKSLDQLERLLHSENHQLIICEMSDKYGSYGKIGLALVEILEDCHHIRLFLMSCRVMAYGIGTLFLAHILRETKKRGKKARADFRHTGRNRMMYVTFKFANFKETAEDKRGLMVMENDLSSIQEIPPYIHLNPC